MRLDKLLSNLGVASRSECREILKKGHVKVNGRVVKSGAENVSGQDEILLDGKLLDARTVRHVMMYKPAGILTAAEDGKQKTVMDLLPELYRACGCMPVGRLDKDTTGLLILTTDGEMAHRLISPKWHVDKIYEAKVDGVLTPEDAAAFEQGIKLQDFTALPAKLEILRPDFARVTVQEGKYHQVKRMFGARGKPVLALHRAAFGPLLLDEHLSPGEFRELTAEETQALYRAAEIKI